MNNTISVENTRAVVADTTYKNSDGAKDAATLESKGGKSLPSSAQEAATPVEPSTAKSEGSKTARVQQAVERLNDYVQSLQRDLRFSVDEDLGQPVVRVVDRNTQKLIRQIPSETVLRLARNLKEVEMQRLQSPVIGVEGSLGLINTRI